MPPIPKFPGLAKLISEAAPALVREGTESIAAKTATAEEKEFLDMLRQQMAEREAFKSEFNLPTAHGTSGEKIAQHMDILDKMELEKKLGSDFLLRSEIASKVPDLTIKEFAPHEALHGTGIYSHPYDPKELSYLGPNYKANEYAVGRGEQIIPLRVRGNKTFNFDNNIHHSVSDKVLTRDQSFQKLSELTGTPVDELKQLSAYDIEKLARRYPDQFENITFQGQIKTFKPESLRGQFAEYDPLKRKSGDYMSGLAGAGLIGASALSSNDAEAAPSFKGLKGLIKGVAPSLEKEAEEAAAKEAFKGQFEPGWYHGTNLEKTGGKQIEEFHPNSFFTKDPDFANLHTGTYSGKQGSHIIPASLNVKNFFNPEDPLQLKTLEKFLIKQYKKNPEMQLFEKMTYPNENYFIDPSKRAKHIIDTLKRKIDAKESTWAILEDKNVEQALKNAGYEGSLLTEMGRQTAVSYAPKNVRLPWAKFDPAKKDSGDILAGIAGATGLGAAAMSSSEAKAEPISASKESTPNVQIFRKKSDDQIMKEQLQKTKAELMQTYLDMNAAYANTPVDQRFAYPGAAENLKGYGAGGAEVSDISPIDFITPGMITAPAKALGKGVAALGREAIEAAPRILSNKGGGFGTPKGYVTDVLPAIKESAQIKGFLPEAEAIETEKNILQLPEVLESDIAKQKAFKDAFNLDLSHGSSVGKLLESELRKKGALGKGHYLMRPMNEPKYSTYKYYDENLKKYVEIPVNEFKPFTEFEASPKGSFGEGVYTAPVLKNRKGKSMADTWSEGVGGFQVPLKARGSKIFNLPYNNDFLKKFSELKDIIPSTEESMRKLSKLSGISMYDLKYKNIDELLNLIRQYPEHFEGISHGGEVNIFNKKNVRLPWAKFDPEMKESGDLLAGLAGAGLSFDQIKKMLEKKSTDKDEL